MLDRDAARRSRRASRPSAASRARWTGRGRPCSCSTGAAGTRPTPASPRRSRTGWPRSASSRLRLDYLAAKPAPPSTYCDAVRTAAAGPELLAPSSPPWPRCEPIRRSTRRAIGAVGYSLGGLAVGFAQIGGGPFGPLDSPGFGAIGLLSAVIPSQIADEARGEDAASDDRPRRRRPDHLAEGRRGAGRGGDRRRRRATSCRCSPARATSGSGERAERAADYFANFAVRELGELQAAAQLPTVAARRAEARRGAGSTVPAVTEFAYHELLPLGPDDTSVPAAHDRRRLHRRGRRHALPARSSPRPSRCSRARPCSTSPTCSGPATWPSWRAILDDPEASANDHFVALELLKNANISAGGVLPELPGHRHGHRQGQEGPVRAHRRRRRGGHRPRRLRHLRSRPTSATRRWRRSPCGTR